MDQGHDDRHHGVDPASEPSTGFPTELAVDPDVVEAIEAEELQAAQRLSSIEAGRRKGGAAGAAMAGAMLALSEIYEGPRRDEIVAVAESPDEPTDIDRDGIEVPVDDTTSVWAPPPPDRTGRTDV